MEMDYLLPVILLASCAEVGIKLGLNLNVNKNSQVLVVLILYSSIHWPVSSVINPL